MASRFKASNKSSKLMLVMSPTAVDRGVSGLEKWKLLGMDESDELEDDEELDDDDFEE